MTKHVRRAADMFNNEALTSGGTTLNQSMIGTQGRFNLNQMYVIRIEGKDYESWFTPIGDVVDNVDGSVRVWDTKEAFRDWLREVDITKEEMHMTMEEPKFTKVPRVRKVFRRLLIPHFGDDSKSKARKLSLCTHLCTQCDCFFSSYFKKCGAFKPNNARLHINSTHPDLQDDDENDVQSGNRISGRELTQNNARNRAVHSIPPPIQQGARFSNKPFIIKVDSKEYETYFSPVDEENISNNRISSEWTTKEAYQEWLRTIDLSDDEKHASVEEPRFQNVPLLKKSFRRLMIPHFGNVGKSGSRKLTLCTHLCVLCNSYFSCFFVKCGMFKSNNARVHIASSHPDASEDVEKLANDPGKGYSKSQLLSEIHAHLVQHTLNLNLPLSTLQSPQLAQALRLASRLPSATFSSVPMETAKSMKRLAFSNFILQVRNLVDFSRKYQDSVKGLKQGVITLFLDCVNLDDNLRVLCSISLVSPVTMMKQNVILGFTKVNIADVFNRLENFGITSTDIWHLVLDKKLSKNSQFRKDICSSVSEYDNIQNFSSYLESKKSGTQNINKTIGKMKEIINSVFADESDTLAYFKTAQELSPVLIDEDDSHAPDKVYHLSENLVKSWHAIDLFYQTKQKSLQASDFNNIAEFEAILRPIFTYMNYVNEASVSMSVLLKLFLEKQIFGDEKDVVALADTGVWEAAADMSSLRTTVKRLSASNSQKFGDVALELQEKVKLWFRDSFCTKGNKINVGDFKESDLLCMVLDPMVMSLGKDFFEALGDEGLEIWERAIMVLETVYRQEAEKVRRNWNPTAITDTSSFDFLCKPFDLSLVSGEIERWKNLKSSRGDFFAEPNQLPSMDDLFEISLAKSALSWFRSKSNRESFPIIHRLAMKYLPKENISMSQNEFQKQSDKDQLGDCSREFEIGFIMATNEPFISKNSLSIQTLSEIQDESENYASIVNEFSKSLIATSKTLMPYSEQCFAADGLAAPFDVLKQLDDGKRNRELHDNTNNPVPKKARYVVL